MLKKHKKEKKMKEIELYKNSKKAVGPENVDALLHVDIMSIDIGYGLIPLVDTTKGGELLERINGIRRQMAVDLGLIVPPIRIRDDMHINEYDYVVKIKGSVVANGIIPIDLFCLMDPKKPHEEIEDIEGISFKEPSFGLSAKWITPEEKERVEKLDQKYTIVDSTTVLSNHLKEIIKKKGYDLLIRQDAKNIVDNLKQRFPVLVEGICPEKISIAKIHRVLQNLLKEQVSIRNLNDIFEILGDHADENRSTQELTDILKASIKEKN